MPIPAGTVFSYNDTRTWFAFFSVAGAGARIKGPWTAFDGHGHPSLALLNGTVDRPSGRQLCPRIALGPFMQLNGSLDTALGPGAYTLFWDPCSSASKIVITNTVWVSTSLFT